MANDQPSRKHYDDRFESNHQPENGAPLGKPLPPLHIEGGKVLLLQGREPGTRGTALHSNVDDLE